MVAALTLIGLLYLLIGSMLAIGVLLSYLFNPNKGPNFLAVLAIIFGWGPFLFWAFVIDGRRESKES